MPPSLQPNEVIKQFVVHVVVPILDVVLSPLTLIAGIWLKIVRRVGVYRMKMSRWIFNRIGVFPIRDHYYEPAFNPRHLHRPLTEERNLPGINLNVEGQLELLERFDYAGELDRIPRRATEAATFFYDNPNFPPGDSEYLYSVVRYYKPRSILEVGSGFSTLIMQRALACNAVNDSSYRCTLRCIEPFEMPWLGAVKGVDLIRGQIENLDASLVEELEANDILFIDSSHVVRPQGDVLRIFLQLLPMLRSGVLVHVHDIFTPRDYPREWLVDEVRIWSEQYLLEAFLSCNSRFRVLGALNFLSVHYPDRLAAKFPVFREKLGKCNPGSIWLQVE